MKLKLAYKNKVETATQAAFIQGETPKEWLAVLNSFNISLSELECYIIPTSKADITAAGMYVIFPSVKRTEHLDLLFAYQKINDRLFIPIQSELYPEIEKTEWKDILYYDKNFFHPTLGLMGFNSFDVVNWNLLLDFPNINEEDWSLAEKGNEPFRALHKINLLLPPEKDIVQTLQEGIEKKSLKDLPKTDEEKKDETFLDKMKRKALEKGLEGTNNFRNNFGSESGGNGAIEGMLSKFENWMSQNLNELQKKRNDEINRLMKLFEDDPEEALKYALPLDSKYWGRGEAAPSGRLGRRNTNFSLGGIGGGGRSSSWDIGDRYYELQQKYRRTAEELVKQKKYKKAAYTYANLLADYSAAANVLKQGKHYHDAAALYKVHLNNNMAAAECYEEGGLYLEAIEMYKKMGSHQEKLGDLYTIIQQDKNAKKYYHEIVDLSKSQGNFIKAGRILEDKLSDEKIARDLYLQGWKENKQKEQCLLRYFEMSEQDLAKEVNQVYEEHTSPHKEMDFLNILIKMQKIEDEELQKTSQKIAYDIISRQSQNGHHKSLQKLKHFVKNDRLIASDINRYISDNREIKIKPQLDDFKVKSVFQFPKDKFFINWIHGKNLHDRFVAFGIENKQLIVAQWDFKEYFEKSSLGTERMPNILLDSSVYLADGYGDIFYYSKDINPNTIYLQGKEDHSLELYVRQPAWLPGNILGMIHITDEYLIVLVVENRQAVLKRYNENSGDLLQTDYCRLSDGSHLIAVASPKLSSLVAKFGRFYMARGKFLTQIAFRGRVTQFNLYGASAQKMEASPEDFTFRLLVATDKGCLLFRPTESGFNPCGQFFETRFPVQSICFLKDYILIAGKDIICLYDLPKDDSTPQLINETDVTVKIVSIHRGQSRKECMVFTEKGEMFTYALNI